MVVSFMQAINNNDVSSSRTVNLTVFDEEKIATEALETIKKNTEKFFKFPDNTNVLNNPIKFLGISVGKFESQDNKPVNTIQEMFKKTNESKMLKERSKSPEPIATNEQDNEENSNEETSIKPETETSIEDKYKNSFFAKYLLKGKQAVSENANDEIIDTSNNGRESPESNDAFDNQMLLDELEENKKNLNKSRSISPQPSTSASTSKTYMETYAEFQRPQFFEINIPEVKCSQCNKMVKETEFQPHTDAHLAFQLSQEQRLEFRKQLKTTTNTKPVPPAKKPKHSTKSQLNTSTAGSGAPSLHKFLVKRESSENLTATSNGDSAELGEDEEMCSECGRKIRISEIAEHINFHAAKRLQMQINQTETSAKRPKVSKSTTKKSNKKTVNNNSIKSVASFFQNS